MRSLWIVVLMGVITAVSPSRSAYSQTIVSRPEIGKPMSNFTFTNVRNYRKSQASLDDFKGKWLFLEMWAANCTGCINGFSKLQSLQDAFSSQVEFFLVGSNDAHYNGGIEKVYDNARRNRNLRIPSAFDSSVFAAWEVVGVPQVFIVDPKGNLRFRTTSYDLTIEKIKKLVAGTEVSFLSSDDGEQYEFRPANAIGLDNLIACSVMTRWMGEQQLSGYDIDVFERFPELWGPGWILAGMPLFELYNYAYLGRGHWLWSDTTFYGRFYGMPVLELKDSSAFVSNFKSDSSTGIYNYCLKLPAAKMTRANIMQELQKNLSYVFGFKASVEKREMPVWKLIARPGAAAKLQATGGRRFISPGTEAAGFTIRNFRMDEFLALATSSIRNPERLAYINETGIKGKIDIVLDGDLTTLEGLRKELQKKGMDLIKGKKEMTALVIRDP